MPRGIQPNPPFSILQCLSPSMRKGKILNGACLTLKMGKRDGRVHRSGPVAASPQGTVCDGPEISPRIERLARRRASPAPVVHDATPLGSSDVIPPPALKKRGFHQAHAGIGERHVFAVLTSWIAMVAQLGTMSTYHSWPMSNPLPLLDIILPSPPQGCIAGSLDKLNRPGTHCWGPTDPPSDPWRACRYRCRGCSSHKQRRR